MKKSNRINLINLRKEKGLTQVQISEYLQISVRQYQALEAGTSDGSIKIWRKLKDLLNAISIDYLLEQEVDKLEKILQEKNNTKKENLQG